METKTYKLKDIAISIFDGVHNTVLDNENGDCFLLSAKNIKNGIISFDQTDRKIDKSTRDKLSKRTKLSKEDVLITTVGTVGELAIVDENYQKYEFQRSVGIIKCNQEIVLPQYLYYLLKTKSYNYYLHVIATGAAQPCIFLSTLKNIKVKLPNLHVQSDVVSVLSKYDKLINNYKKQIEDLQNLASELYKEWFVRFRFPGHEKTSFENGIPAGWKYVKISTAYNSSSGGTPSRQCLEYYENGIYPWIKTGELKDSLILESEEYITESAIQNSSAKLFEKDSLIIAMYGATIGQIGINKMQATCNQACCVLRPKDNVPCGIYFLYMFFLFNRNYLISLGSGAAQQNLSQVVINKLNFLLPKTEVIEQFEKLEKSIFDRMCVFQKKISVISKQRDLLLPRLMSGELEVK